VTEQEILRFVEKSFRSVWPLELLAVISQEPERAWQIDTLVRESRASLSLVVDGLAALVATQMVLVDHQRTYRLASASTELAALARDLVDLYNRKPRAVMRAVFSEPADRIQTFADAFRLRKDPC
jgi:hypothetical protein